MTSIRKNLFDLTGEQVITPLLFTNNPPTLMKKKVIQVPTHMSEQECVQFFYDCIRASGFDSEAVPNLMDLVYRYEFALPMNMVYAQFLENDFSRSVDMCSFNR